MSQFNKTMIDGLTAVAKTLGLYELLGPTWVHFESIVCTVFMCSIFDEFSVSKPSAFNDASRAILSDYRAKSGASVKQLLHLAQLSQYNDFVQYDHGSSQNLKKYGQSSVPRLDLAQVTVPTAFFVGKNDELATPAHG